MFFARKGCHKNEKTYRDKNYWGGTRHLSGVVSSFDEGKTYSRFGCFESEEHSVWEPNAVELENGHILVLARASGTNRLGMAESFDYGITWGEYKVSDIPNSLMNKENDSLNFNERTKLFIRISKDYARSWGEPIYIDKEESNIFLSSRVC